MCNYFQFISTVVRLQGPLSANGIGRIEVFYNDHWGTICDDSWDMNDANVVCRQLGYKYAVRALQGSDVPDGSGQIWLDDVNCTGSGKNLSSCSHKGWGNHNCDHSQDAGVECSSKGKIIIFHNHSLISMKIVAHMFFSLVLSRLARDISFKTVS